MKRLLILFFLLYTLAASAQTPWNWGYMDVATPSFTVGSGTAVNIGGYIPKGATSFSLTVFDGDLILNSSQDLVGGTYYNGDKVASGTSITWTGMDPEQAYAINIYGLALGVDGLVTVKLRCWRGTMP